ncbi:hypothetical protein [Streptomyces acidiscabies]|uniref:hypothetical protein n=1 Tax=Streptomyces acidiscabies TaxID=42234 RepID=UPI0038F6C413
MPSSGVGLNLGFGDEHMGDAKVTSLMKAAGVRQLRYPGGSGADEYHWKTHTSGDGKGWIPSNTNFDSFMTIAKKVGAQPILTANYGSGTVQEAADWVKYSNVDKGYGVKYWEIGNEVYGNGHYGNGKGWERDDHADKSPAAARARSSPEPAVQTKAACREPVRPRRDGRAAHRAHRAVRLGAGPHRMVRACSTRSIPPALRRRGPGWRG